MNIIIWMIDWMDTDAAAARNERKIEAFRTGSIFGKGH